MKNCRLCKTEEEHDSHIALLLGATVFWIGAIFFFGALFFLNLI